MKPPLIIGEKVVSSFLSQNFFILYKRNNYPSYSCTSAGLVWILLRNIARRQWREKRKRKEATETQNTTIWSNLAPRHMIGAWAGSLFRSRHQFTQHDLAFWWIKSGFRRAALFLGMSKLFRNTCLMNCPNETSWGCIAMVWKSQLQVLPASGLYKSFL